jgi:hypothetical protein
MIGGVLAPPAVEVSMRRVAAGALGAALLLGACGGVETTKQPTLPVDRSDPPSTVPQAVPCPHPNHERIPRCVVSANGDVVAASSDPVAVISTETVGNCIETTYADGIRSSRCVTPSR